jgi:hypothetical protein
LDKTSEEIIALEISGNIGRVLSDFIVAQGTGKIVLPSEIFLGAGVYFAHPKHNKITFNIERK